MENGTTVKKTHKKLKNTLKIIILLILIILISYIATPFINIANAKNYNVDYLINNTFINTDIYLRFLQDSGVYKRINDDGILKDTFTYTLNEDGIINIQLADEGTSQEIIIYDNERMFNITEKCFLYLYNEENE